MTLGSEYDKLAYVDRAWGGFRSEWGVLNFPSIERANQIIWGMSGMKRLIVLLAVCSSFMFADSVMATPVYPTLDTVLSDGGGSLLVTDMSLLTGITEGGESYVHLTDLTSPETAVATILLEAASYAQQNELGIYNYNGAGVAPSASEMLLIIQGADAVPESATIQFDLVGGIAWYDRNSNSTQDPGETATVGSTFGFYLNSPDSDGGISDPTFYTDELLNPDTTAVEHGLIYDTRHVTGAITGDPDVVVAFEDLLEGHSDHDYTDMVVGVTDLAPVPEPATVTLLGLCSLALVRKKRRA